MTEQINCFLEYITCMPNLPPSQFTPFLDPVENNNIMKVGGILLVEKQDVKLIQGRRYRHGVMHTYPSRERCKSEQLLIY
jgi:hypothetical protein